MSHETAGRPILLVEDDENDILFFQLAMQRADLNCPLQIANDGREAVAYLAGEGVFADRIQRPLPRLVVLDLNLPFKSGLEVLKWIRQQQSLNNIPVIILTSSTAKSDQSPATILGANAYCVKPGDPLQLSEFVANLKSEWLGQDEDTSGL